MRGHVSATAADRGGQTAGSAAGGRSAPIVGIPTTWSAPMSDRPDEGAARMLYTCTTAGCEAADQGFTDEPTFCSLCLHDLAGVYDTTGTFKTEDELRV